MVKQGKHKESAVEKKKKKKRRRRRRRPGLYIILVVIKFCQKKKKAFHFKVGHDERLPECRKGGGREREGEAVVGTGAKKVSEPFSVTPVTPITHYER